MKRIEDYIVPVIACVPLSVSVTLLLHDFWSWFEMTTGFESIGHFGPAAWCFFLMYAVMLSVFLTVQKFLKKRKKSKV